MSQIRTTWRNWAGTEIAHPTSVVVPGDVDEVRAVVRAATAAGRRVKAVGSGHSFTGVAVTDGVQVRLDALAHRLDITDCGLATVGAGWVLHDLNRELAARGWALSNLGDIDRQTVSGAISTGTHGTGARFGSLSQQVRALELVLADGDLVRCDRGHDPKLFDAARVGLGAFGVLTAITVQCEPAFALHAVEAPMRLAEVLSDVDQLVAANDHFEFYWFPHTDRTMTKRNNRVPRGTALQPLGRARAYLDDELLSNRVFELLNRLSTAVPQSIPLLSAVSARALGRRTFTDASQRVFPSARTVRFRESEWALPVEAMAQALREVQQWIERSGERLLFPVEVRFGPADDPWLSTSYGRPTAWIAVHQYHRRPHDRFFDAVQHIMASVDGRPHWGKLHTLNAERLRTLYPRFDDALAVRDRVDPSDTFANDYLRRVFS